MDFPATFEVDGGNVVRGNAAAGSTRQAFEYGGEMCQEDGTNPTGNQVWVTIPCREFEAIIVKFALYIATVTVRTHSVGMCVF